MKSNIIVIVIVVLGIRVAQAQVFSSSPFNDAYLQYQEIANQYYSKRQYDLASENYCKGFLANANRALVDDRYKLAACWSMLGKNDSAFVQLNMLANNRYQKYNSIMINQEFVPLHQDNRWLQFILKIKDNRSKYNPGLNMLLVETLDTILQNDQKYRRMKEVLSQDSIPSNDLDQLILFNDSINTIKIEKFLETYGWPAVETIGQEGNDAIFLVIQHSSLKVQQKLFKYVLSAVQQKSIPPSYQALLEDRIAISKGQKQIYGTQVGMDKKGKYYVEPIYDAKNVDSRRAIIGLGPLSEYLKQWDIAWPEN